jgi:hypothetical protein
MPSDLSAMAGSNCVDSIGHPTCGDGQWCLQEMDAGEGDGGVCVPYCDPSTVGSCAGGYACSGIGVALVPSAPVIHVCQVIGSDAGLPSVGTDGGEPQQGSDASVPDGSRDHLLFDALPP